MTLKDQAQALADALGKPVYIATVRPSNALGFGASRIREQLLVTPDLGKCVGYTQLWTVLPRAREIK